MALALCPGSSEAIDSRQPAPRFSAKTMEGERFTNKVVMGKPVLLQFWTTWCGYCRRDQETVDDLAKEFEAKGLVVLAVNVGESRKKVKQYLDSRP
ncbi:MAG: TlpA family protein disulfide reductase, partial [Bryobacterales bacterium]|nr:TlpA family protein disulfide reductase [Bryobacterales bacterium]